MSIDARALTGSLMATAVHCPPLPMIRAITSTTWEGPPGQGHQIETATFRCQCGAELTATLRTPC